MISAGTPVLVIAPHGLDEVLGVGGCMTLLAQAGSRVETLIMGGDGAADAARRMASVKVAELLGTNSPRYAGFPENRSDGVDLLDIVSVIETTARDTAAAVVFVPHGGNLNVDHQTSFNAAMVALRPVPGSPVRMILAYEILSSTDWAPAGYQAGFQPTIFIDISTTLERKVEALRLYGPGMRPEPHARSIENVMRLAKLRGSTVGLAAAEAFAAVRIVGAIRH